MLNPGRFALSGAQRAQRERRARRERGGEYNEKSSGSKAVRNGSRMKNYPKDVPRDDDAADADDHDKEDGEDGLRLRGQ